jgi:ribosomal protein L37E
VHPLRDQSYSNCGNPGEGTHSWTAAPNNWQSDNAIDFCTSVGTNVYAIEDGVICSSCGYGKMYMTVSHSDISHC